MDLVRKGEKGVPKPTFYNLPEAKKWVLIQAVKHEFSRVPLHKASIENIVKEAGISRGSFYQYFEDKEDAFYFLVNQWVKEKKDTFFRFLHQCKGNIFETMICFFSSILKEEKDWLFIKYGCIHRTYKFEYIVMNSFTEPEINEKFSQFCKKLNVSQLNVSDEEQLFHMMQMIAAVTFHNLSKKFACDLSYDSALCNYEIEIRLLQEGFTTKK